MYCHALEAAVHELRNDGHNDVGEPGHDGGDDAQPAERDHRVADGRRRPAAMAWFACPHPIGAAARTASAEQDIMAFPPSRTRGALTCSGSGCFDDWDAPCVGAGRLATMAELYTKLTSAVQPSAEMRSRSASADRPGDIPDAISRSKRRLLPNDATNPRGARLRGGERRVADGRVQAARRRLSPWRVAGLLTLLSSPSWARSVAFRSATSARQTRRPVVVHALRRRHGNSAVPVRGRRQVPARPDWCSGFVVSSQTNACEPSWGARYTLTRPRPRWISTGASPGCVIAAARSRSRSAACQQRTGQRHAPTRPSSPRRTARSSIATRSTRSTSTSRARRHQHRGRRAAGTGHRGSAAGRAARPGATWPVWLTLPVTRPASPPPASRNRRPSMLAASVKSRRCQRDDHGLRQVAPDRPEPHCGERVRAERTGRQMSARVDEGRPPMSPVAGMAAHRRYADDRTERHAGRALRPD